MLRAGRVAILSFLSATLFITATVPAATPPPFSPFLNYMRRFGDALLEHARDTYGPRKSGLFLSALDRGTMAPLTSRPMAPAGIREGDRDGPPNGPLVGANPQHDENLLVFLHVLTELTFKPEYRKAAEDEMKWFLENTMSPETHLLPWGEHLSWNVMTDEPILGAGKGRHEFFRPWVLWDSCFALAPDASRAFALGLWEHQIADQETGAFDRHAAYAEHDPKDGNDFPRHAGFYIRTWAAAYKHTRDDVFLKAIDTVLARYEKRRDPQTGWIQWVARETRVSPLSTLSLAIDCEAASRIVPDPLASRLRRFAAREDEVFCALPHDLQGKRGFVTTADKATGQAGGELTPLWDAKYGGSTTAQVGMMCTARYENGGFLAYRDLIRQAADLYLDSLPDGDIDAWPMTFGQAVSLQLSAWRLTAKPRYLERAQELAEIGFQRFWGDSGLPRASLKTNHYESITGADTLALSMLELHLTILHITAIKCPVNTIDR